MDRNSLPQDLRKNKELKSKVAPAKTEHRAAAEMRLMLSFRRYLDHISKCASASIKDPDKLEEYLEAWVHPMNSDTWIPDFASWVSARQKESAVVRASND